MQNAIKKLLRLVITVAVIFLAVRWCSKQFGSVITLPGGSGDTGGSIGSGKGSTEGSGGWFSPKKQNDRSTTNEDLIEDVEDLERELGIGKYQGQTPSTKSTTPTTTTTPSATSSAPLSFKGIPISGSLSTFGNELVKAGFRNAGNGTYTGSFAGYDGCKVTPFGNPVQEVRIDFPVISDWEALEKAYDNLQADLTRKYGIDPVVNRNLAVYNLPNGNISLDADVSNQSTWHVILKYKNAITTTSTGTLGRNPIDDL
ncbi:MAG: hypothetical protein J6P75_08600 [Bacteroidales bacterium]|nr:hypothetical protein [Bacteroidales bacterium]